MVYDLRFTILSIKLYDVLGQIIFSEQPPPNNHHHEFSFDISKLEPGIYFVKVRTEKADVVKKLVKQ